MRRYQITKIVFARNIAELYDLEKGGEITYVELKDDIKTSEDIGFIKNTNDDR